MRFTNHCPSHARKKSTCSRMSSPCFHRLKRSVAEIHKSGSRGDKCAKNTVRNALMMNHASVRHKGCVRARTRVGGRVVGRERERERWIFFAELNTISCRIGSPSLRARVHVCVWCRTLPPVRKKKKKSALRSAYHLTCAPSSSGGGTSSFTSRNTLGPGDGSAAAAPPALTEKRTHRAGRMPLTSRQMLSLIGTTCLWLPLLAEVCSRHPLR